MLEYIFYFSLNSAFRDCLQESSSSKDIIKIISNFFVEVEHGIFDIKDYLFPVKYAFQFCKIVSNLSIALSQSFMMMKTVGKSTTDVIQSTFQKIEIQHKEWNVESRVRLLNVLYGFSFY